MAGSAVEDVLAEVRATGLLRSDRPLVVMVSGGRDSVCLLDVVTRLTGGRSVSALHVNYALRDAAAGDETLCRELCLALEVPLEVRRPSPRTGGNLHAWARRERYGAARELAGEGDVAVGHTASDQVETILYRLASSPSRRALLGMAPREGRLVRPLLAVMREQTAAYCRARGLRWREDESNDSLAYARARVRRGVVPAFREVHPAAEQNLLTLAARLRDEASVLDGLVEEVLRGASNVPLAQLRELPPALARLVVQRLADEAAGRPAAGVARRTEELLALRDHGLVQLDVGVGLRAVCQAGRLHFEPLSGATGRRDAPVAS